MECLRSSTVYLKGWDSLRAWCYVSDNTPVDRMSKNTPLPRPGIRYFLHEKLKWERSEPAAITGVNEKLVLPERGGAPLSPHLLGWQ